MALWLLCGCSSQPKFITVEGYMLGTTFRVVASTTVPAEDIYSDIMRIDALAKSSMSIFNPASLISRINDNSVDTLDIHLLRNMAVAAHVNAISDGMYDITVKPLTDAYGFAAKGKIEHPNIDSLIRFVGFDKFSISGNRIIKADKRVQFDLNSLAKGYTVDLVADHLERLGCCNYLVEIGGEICASGKNAKGVDWRIGIDTPYEGNQTPGQNCQTVVQISDKALATSGNYRRYYTDAQGNKITHTINPKTGKSTHSSLLSATVIANRCVVADAMATMFMAMGDSAAKELAAKLTSEGIEVYFILSKGEEYEIFSTIKE